MLSIHHKSFEGEIREEEIENGEGDKTDGARFIDDCFNIRRGPENFIVG